MSKAVRAYLKTVCFTILCWFGAWSAYWEGVEEGNHAWSTLAGSFGAIAFVMTLVTALPLYQAAALKLRNQPSADLLSLFRSEVGHFSN
jgi:hypothetical protein